MTKVLLGFQFIVSSLVHLFCCGFPLLMSISGGLGLAMALQSFAPFIFCFQLILSVFVFYQLYNKSLKIVSKSVRQQRIVFWLVTSLSVVLFFYPPSHWFKSEETKLKKSQIERFFKYKNQ